MYEYKGLLFAEITKEEHTELMKYWTEEKKDLQMPVENVFSYLCWFEKDKYWDAIQAMESPDGFLLFGESFIHKEYALRWLAGEYDDTEELKEEDRKAGK